MVSALALFSMLIQGYHPCAEDGGVYIPAVKRLLTPGLYRVAPAFVLAPARTSFFAPFVATLVQLSHLPLPWALLLLYAASTWFTLFAAWLLACRCTPLLSARAGAVALLACWLSLPIAGTSLLLIDPYVTARSISTPLVLLALALALQHRSRRWLFSALVLALAALFHPLMAGYGAAGVLCIAAASLEAPRRRMAATLLLIGAALAVAIIVHALPASETPAYQTVVLTRYYWFPLQWRWYEQLGVLAPMLILAWFARPANSIASGGTSTLARAALLLGFTALSIALIFSHPSLSHHLVARLQPLRALQIVYIVMMLLIGSYAGGRWLGRHSARWIFFLAVCAVPMLIAQRRTYSSSGHLEAPWTTPHNPWQLAFLWVRGHTPRDALFALDANYITRGAHEDAQGFRAIAERDTLPDYSKDGGEAAIAPDLSPAWKRGLEAQLNLEHKTDSQRAAALQPLGVTWVVLQTESLTRWSCPYTNHTVKVCRLP